jgi:hypothetical protein
MLRLWVGEARLCNSILDGMRLWMECVAFDGELGHFGVADLDALGVSLGVAFAGDCQTRLCWGCGDQRDDSQAAGQRPATPILGDVTVEAVRDLVPFRGAGRRVAHHKGQARRVGAFLQLDFPRPDAAAIATAASRARRRGP